MLFNTTIFGPIHSRRLGTSLGVNLEPDNGKICSFDCIYCECGLNVDGRNDRNIPTLEEVSQALENKLVEYNSDASNPPIDTITFAGNGEPTLHPQFAAIIDMTLAMRDRYAPKAKVSVLTNAWQISRQSVAEALMKVDNNILKLDSAIASTVSLIDRPVNPHFDLDRHIDELARFRHNGIIQTMFLRGEVDGVVIDNTTEAEVSAWLSALRRIEPRMVQVYSIDRKTPYDTLVAVPKDELEAIAARVRAAGFDVYVA